MDNFARGRARGMIRKTTASQQQPSSFEQSQQQYATAGGGDPQAATGTASGNGAAGEAVGVRTMRRGGKSNITTLPPRADGDYTLGPRKQFDSALFAPETRPQHITSKKGSYGGKVSLRGSYFRLRCAKNWKLCQYSVSYDPIVDNVRVRRAMLFAHKDVLGEVFIFDGTVLFSTKMLPDKVTTLESKRKFDDSTVKITITFTKDLTTDSNIALQLYNIIFRWILTKVGQTQVGRHYYNPKAKQIINCGRVSFEMWPGFQTSILQYENDILLCSQVSHKLMRNNTVLDALRECNEEAKRRRKPFKDVVDRFLNGQIVLTKYNNKTYKIDGVDWKSQACDKFAKFDKSQISYVQYYKEHYDITISDHKQPLLISTPKKSDVRKQLSFIRLVPELCTLTGLTDQHRADFQVMKALAVHTKQGPEKVATTLCNFVKQINTNNECQKLLNDWGLSFENNLVDVPARELPPEMIQLGDKQVRAGPTASWDCRGRLLRCVDLRSWCFIYSQRDAQVAKSTTDTLNKVCGPMGFKVGRPTMCGVQRDNLDAFHQCLKQVVSETKDLQMIFVLLSSNAKEKYDSLKALCCSEFGIPSQFAVSRTLQNPKRLMSVCTKIAIQMNVKLGGEAWSVDVPLKGFMVIGIDTYHDSSRRGASVGGFVSSFNQALTRWHSQPTFPGVNMEFLDALVPLVKSAIENFKKHNQGRAPQQICVYRDGVGDGQIRFVQEHEIPQIQEALKAYCQPPNKIKLIVIIVTKRLSGRFFKPSGRGLVNPQPGTVIDDVVTKNSQYDFFVVSQSAREGTVTPTHFNVIHDESTLKADHLQRLSYKLCHLYFNWSGTVRVPAPCLYAHKLAFLIGQSVHREVSRNLADKLYYL